MNPGDLEEQLDFIEWLEPIAGVAFVLSLAASIYAVYRVFVGHQFGFPFAIVAAPMMVAVFLGFFWWLRNQKIELSAKIERLSKNKK